MSGYRKKPATLTVTVTTAGTRVPLSATNILTHDFTVQADLGNTGTIYIGGSNVSAAQHGIALNSKDVAIVGNHQPGNKGQVEFNLIDWYVDASSNGQIVHILYYTDNSAAF